MNRKVHPQPMVWWMLWATFQAAVLFYYHFLGSAPARVPRLAPESTGWLVSLAPLGLSIIVRWIILPKASNPQQAFVIFILGIATAELCCFLGIFIFPTHKQTLFALSSLGILQFIPIFASKYDGK